jgi:integrase
VPAWAKRLATPDSQTPAHSETAIDRLIARRDVGLRERTLYRLLFETAARAEEILALNIEDEGICGQATPIPCDGRSRGSDTTAKPSSQYETAFSNG